MTQKTYSLEKLPNGLYRLFNYACQWHGVYNPDGSFRHGNTSSVKHLNEVAEKLIHGKLPKLAPLESIEFE